MIDIESGGLAILSHIVQTCTGNVLSLAIQIVGKIARVEEVAGKVGREKAMLRAVFRAVAAPGANASGFLTEKSACRSIPTHGLTLFSNLCEDNPNVATIVALVASEHAYAEKGEPCMQC